MDALSPLLRRDRAGRLGFWCPSCGEAHWISIAPQHWTWNGRSELPTFTPSILVRSGHYLDGVKAGEEGCWCRYNADHPEDGIPFSCLRCHSFVTDGRIQYLSDCSHHLADQTIPIPAWPSPE